MTSKKTLSYITVFWILMMLISCTNNQSPQNGYVKPYPHVINLSEGFRNQADLKLSDIADSIKYVVLSKNKEVIIGNFRRVQMTDSDIYINADGLVLRFDLEGKFLNTIGQNGRGPEEYMKGSPYSTTPKNDAIFVSKGIDPEYLIFNPDGVCLGKKKFPSSSKNLFDFVFISDSTLLNTYWFIGSFMAQDYLNEMSCTFGLFESNGHSIKTKQNPLRNTKISKDELKKVVIQNPTFTFFNNRAVLTQLGDTIFEISENSVVPGFIIQWDKLQHKKTVNDLYFRQSGTQSSEALYSTFMETTQKAFFPASNNGIDYMFEYDKISGISRSMELNRKNIGFINDIDGGSNFYPYWTNRAGDIWITDEDAITFKQKHSDDLISKSTAINPAYKEKLREFTKSLNADDNPVLKILYLKKYKN
jgi:hypothetical protein